MMKGRETDIIVRNIFKTKDRDVTKINFNIIYGKYVNHCENKC